MSAHCTVDHLLMFTAASDTETCSTGSKLISGALALTVPLGYILLHEQKWRVNMYTTVDSHSESTICPNILGVTLTLIRLSFSLKNIYKAMTWQ